MTKLIVSLAGLLIPSFCYCFNPYDIIVSGNVGYPFALGNNAYHNTDTTADFRFAYDVKAGIFLSKKLSIGIFYGGTYLHRTLNAATPQGGTVTFKIRSFLHQFDPYAEYQIQLTKKLFMTPQAGFGYTYYHTVLLQNKISPREVFHNSGFNIMSGLSLGYKLSSRTSLEAQGSYCFSKLAVNEEENISYNKQVQIFSALLGVAYRL